MGFSLFARKRARALLGLINIAIAIATVQVVAARETGPRPEFPAVSVAQEAATIEGLRVEPADVLAGSARVAAPVARNQPLATRAVASSKMPIAGKGMWIWLFDEVEGGNPARIVRRAKMLGLSHIYVRSSSTTSGFKYLHHIDRVVPVAHAAGLKVIAWDFPTLKNPVGDAHRVARVISHRTPGGERVDGMAIDLETPSEGVHLTAGRALQFSRTLARLRPTSFRVLVPPRPSPSMQKRYPYGIIRYYSAVAPMVYWISRDPLATVRSAIFFLRKFHKPIAPIGQAYDASVDGGPAGSPSGATLLAFAEQARRAGAVGVSFWSWQHATSDELRGIARISFPVSL
ncbi:MAG: hypothetical protein ABR548_09640 [Actinomycetota bacterium]|nr:hypothetical protein [Actinomycetota bacterium]